MTWSDLLPTLSGITSSVIVVAVATAVGSLFKEGIFIWLAARIQHKLDAKLEVIREDLATKGRQIEALHSGPIAIRAQRQAIIDRRWLEAIDQLWAAVKVLEPLRANCTSLAVIRWDVAAKRAENEEKTRQFFDSISATTPKLVQTRRTFISTLCYTSCLGIIQCISCNAFLLPYANEHIAPRGWI